MIAWCWSDGSIEMGRTVPEGAIEVARGGQDRLFRAITATATLRGSEGYQLPGLAGGVSPEQTLKALEEYVAWLGTLDLGIKVNHPLQSIGLLPANATGHGVACMDLHDALRLQFQLTREEAELACLLLNDPEPPLQPAASGANPVLLARIRTLYAKTGSMGHKELLRRLQSVSG